MAYDVATLEKKYKVTVPARMKKLVKELAKYKGAKLKRPIDGKLTEYSTVVLGSAQLFDTNLFDKRLHPGFIPIAALADDRGSWRLELFALACGDTASGAVFFGRAMQAGGLAKVTPTLDAFLAKLALPPA